MRRNTIDISKETLERLYWDERLSMKAIAEKLGLSITPIYRSMERYNIKRRPLIEYKQIDRLKLGISEAQLRKWYIQQQLPIVYISYQTGVGAKTIRKLLQDYQIPIRSNSEVNKISAPKRLRDKHGHGRNWRGGIVHNANGYTMLWDENRQRYVYEHILVWEQTHSRPLPKGWVVHHLNGIKSDNRPENLAGMIKSAHTDLAKPFKARIRQLEAKLKELQ